MPKPPPGWIRAAPFLPQRVLKTQWTPGLSQSHCHRGHLDMDLEILSQEKAPPELHSRAKLCTQASEDQAGRPPWKGMQTRQPRRVQYTAPTGWARAGGLPVLTAVWDHCPAGLEQSKQMLIGCLGTERSKARKLPGEDSGENTLLKPWLLRSSRLFGGDASSC